MLTERGAFALLTVFIVVACIPHGLIAPAARVGLQIFSFALAAIVALVATNPLSRSARRLAGLIILLAGAGLVQIMPLPASVVAVISPSSARIYHESSTLLKNSGRPAVPPRISIAPVRTAETALQMLAYAALVYASSKLASNKRRRRLLASAVVLAAMLQILTVVLAEQPGRIRGTFGVSNNLAALLGIAFATAAAFSLGERRQSLHRAALFIVGLLVAGVALVRTGSTGGLAAAIYATALLFLIERVGPRLRHGIAMGTTLAGPVAGLAISVALAAKGSALLTAIAPPSIARETMRVSMWVGALDVWRQFPVLGAGLGAFEDAFRSPSIVRSVAHPHHELLNVAATAGTVGVVIATVALISTWSALLRNASESPSIEGRSIALAAFGALSAITIHGFVDFPLAVPAIGAVLASLVGAGLSESEAED